VKKALSVLLGVVVILAGCRPVFAETKIQDGSKVELAYSFDADGIPMVSEQNKETMKLVEGAGAYPPTFERQLLGMRKGDKKTIHLTPEEGFGPVRPELLKRVALKELPKGLKLEEGDLLGAKSGAKPIRVAKILDDSVVLDENHPLAGKSLIYQVQILSIQ